jgi:hypothetical protein
MTLATFFTSEKVLDGELMRWPEAAIGVQFTRSMEEQSTSQ